MVAQSNCPPENQAVTLAFLSVPPYCECKLIPSFDKKFTIFNIFPTMH